MARQSVSRMFGSRVGVAMLTGLAALTAAAIAFATIPDADGMIQGCYNSKGELRIIDDDTTTCRTSETALSWSESGIVGYELIVSETRQVPLNAFVVAEVRCTPGKRVLGGGYHSNNVVIVQSSPQTSGGIERWQVAAVPALGFPGTVTAYVICAFASP